MSNHVVFLDIDGVLAPILDHLQYGEIDPDCMEILNAIVQRSGADVVVSSSWRFGKSVFEMQEILERHGFNGRVVDSTPTESRGLTRGEEIGLWLADHPTAGYVILDDHTDMGPLIDHLVRTNAGVGLHPTHIDRALQVLSVESDGNPATEPQRGESSTEPTVRVSHIDGSPPHSDR